MTEPNMTNCLAPTMDVVEKFACLVMKTCELRGDQGMLNPAIAEDCDGGIRIEWFGDARELRLAIRSEKDPYLFHEQGDEYAIEKDVAPETLAWWIDWFENGRQGGV